MVYCLLVIFLLPGYIHGLNDAIHLVIDALRAFGGLIALVLFMTNSKSSTAKAIVIYISFVCIITICSLSSANMVRFVAIYADIFAIVIFTDYLVSKEPRSFLRVMHRLLMAGLILNCASVAACPNGLLQVANEAGAYGPYYLYGYDNSFIVYYLPTVAVTFLYEKYQKGKSHGGIETFAVLALCFASSAYLHSMASSAAFGFLLILYCLLHHPNRSLSLISISWLIYCTLDIMLIGGALLSQDSQIISSVGKGTSFAVRESMWSHAIELIATNPLLGTGVLSTGEMRSYFGYATLHNTLLNLVFWSGFAGLLIFSKMIFAMQEELRAATDRYDSFFLSCLFGTFLLASFTGCLELEGGIYLLFLVIGNYRAISSLKPDAHTT